jgi:hypothetical protein
VTVGVATVTAILARRLDLGDPGAGEDAQDGDEARRGETTSSRAFTVPLGIHQAHRKTQRRQR